MKLPNWLADDDISHISKTVKKTNVPLTLEYDTGFSPPTLMYGIVCPNCKTKGEDKQVWPRDIIINGMGKNSSNCDQVTFILECENCQTTLELNCTKRSGFFMNLIQHTTI
jgi:hypothetical protein